MGGRPSHPIFSERREDEVQGMRCMKSSREFRRTIAPFRALPFVFVATDSRRRAGQCMPVGCQCRRIRASPGSSGMCKDRLFMRIIGPAWTRLDHRFLTRNEQVSGSSPLVGSPYLASISQKLEVPRSLRRKCRGFLTPLK
jgi:hypothetical protein